MRNTIERLNYLIREVPIRVNQFSELVFAEQLLGKWSKKETLGHLCDSAINNLQRFIKFQIDGESLVVEPYSQNNWILIQDYQGIPTCEIVDYWATLNRQIVRVISKIPEEKLLYLCDIGDNKAIYFRCANSRLYETHGASPVSDFWYI